MPFSEPLFVWDEFDVFQLFMNKAPVFDIGALEPSGPKIYPNPIKIALQYQQMLDEGIASSQAELARILGVSRAKVTQMLNLLKLDEGIQEFMLDLEDTDERLKMLTERRLRSLTGIVDRKRQREHCWKIVDSCTFRVFSQNSSAQNDGQKRTLHESPTASSQRTRRNR